jgi:hypothetical protein
MRVLHIASFDGNIGDHANHSGFRRCMNQYISSDIEYTNMEIREFYKSWNLRRFDMDFADYVNAFDLLVIGGGNFFEMCWDYSSTGTTIDLSPSLLKMIKCPILFNGLGIDDKKGTVSEDNIDKFGRFLSELTSSDRYLVSVRNDGSKEIAEKYFSSTITDKVIKIPDGGFFVLPKDYIHPEIPEGYKVIAINVAGDSAGNRFSTDGKDGRIAEREFVLECAEYINQMLELDSKIFFVFVPHIAMDNSLISKVIGNVKDCFVRRRISIAPCVNGSLTDGDYNLDIYRKSMLTLGMRYHANICSLAVGTPSIGIVNFHKHKCLFEDIGLSDRVVASDLPDFKTRLYNKTLEFMDNIDEKKEENKKLYERLNKENELYFNLIRRFLLGNNLLVTAK